MHKPNVLVFLLDELGAPRTNETPEIKKWRHDYLKAEKFLSKNGFSFKNHYCSSIACTPSRCTIFTGQYSSLTGVSQTYGGGKTEWDGSMYYLDPNTVPTLGDYFREGGYNTFYTGKWHLSRADILIPGSQNPLTCYNEDGSPNIENINIYKRAKRLEDYGFTGYQGQEPVGNNPLNSGSSSSNEINGRDVIYTQEAIDLLKDLDSSESKKPWLTVVSLVNPHDIALYGEITKNAPGFNFKIDPSVPYIPESGNAKSGLENKPVCQQAYKEMYQRCFQPTIDDETYRKLYYSLNLEADRNIQKILKQLNETKFVDNTIILFLSDHSDLLGSFGMHQKWYCSYNNAIHIPMIIKLPSNFPCSKSPQEINSLTSNVDIIPTLLSLCGISEKDVYKKLIKTHHLTRRLVGNDLSGLLLKGQKFNPEPILFINDDNVFLGNNMVTFAGNPYKPIIQPTNIRTVITYLDETLWKFSIYFEDTNFWTNEKFNKWSTPSKHSVKISDEDGVVTKIGKNTIVTTYIPKKPEYEMYNLNNDPLEINNLMYNPTKEILDIAKILKNILKEQIIRKMLIPSRELIVPNLPEGIDIRAP